MKKIVSACMTIFMTVALGVSGTVPAFAEGEKGSITINSPVAGQTYSIYRMLDLESYDVDSGAYSYKVNSDWDTFFETETAKGYTSVDKSGYVTWVENAEPAEFAKLALDWAKDNSITETKSVTALETDTSIIFNDLELGYYLIDSTTGALCGLTTTNPNASVSEKNGVPFIDKQVQEDSTLKWGDSNTADIGQVVNFRVIINAYSGAENYILHDKMSQGLTFTSVTGVEKTDGENTETLTENTDYTVISSNLKNDETFEVHFTPSLCSSLDSDDSLIVYYEAILNEDAVIAGAGNPNESYMEYGDDNETTHDTTVTKTFEFDVIKTDSSDKLIDGAKFRIYDKAKCGKEIKVVKEADGTYRMAMKGETGVEIEVKDGKAKISGFDNGTYYLEETEAPKGYNKLNARQKFVISDSNLNAEFTDDGVYCEESGVQVINKAGSVLPETGGQGKALIISGGVILMLTTGVVLVSRKRMSKISA